MTERAKGVLTRTETSSELLARAGATRAVIAARDMGPGWVSVVPDAITDDGALTSSREVMGASAAGKPKALELTYTSRRNPRGPWEAGRMRPTRTLIGAVVVATVALAAPAADAAGFGPVRNLSPTTGKVHELHAAVAPTGETALMWRHIGPRNRSVEYVAAIGRDPERLGPRRIVRAARGSASWLADAKLLARPNGGFVACFTSVEDIGCTFTDERRTFGPLRPVARRSARDLLSWMAVRADGQLTVVLSRRTAKGRQELRSTTLDDQGRRGPMRPLATVGPEAYVTLATTDDGSTAVAWSTRQRRQASGRWNPSLRLTAPGQDTFGAPQSFLGAGTVGAGESIRLQGGRELRIFVTGDGTSIDGPLIISRLPDGSFSAPLRLPRPAAGVLRGTVAALPDGMPVAVSGTWRESRPGCPNTQSAVVGVGPLVSDPRQARNAVQRLSQPGQLAESAAVATLTDGTVIAAWRNTVNSGGDARMEVALRRPGATAFQPSQVLPQIAADDSILTAGGHQAVMAWIVGDVFDGPSHVAVTSLRSSPPYAAPARLPKRPRTTCR